MLKQRVYPIYAYTSRYTHCLIAIINLISFSHCATYIGLVFHEAFLMSFPH